MAGESNTRFTSRGRLSGVIRGPGPAGTGQNRATRAERRDSRGSVDEALYYRARLILGDSLPRPGARP